jgi:hypothetical protein
MTPLVLAASFEFAAGADPEPIAAAANPATTTTASRAAPPTRRMTDGFITPPVDDSGI